MIAKLLTILSVFLLFFVKPADAQYDFEVAATTEIVAPGTGGETFKSFIGARTFLSRDGDIVFKAYYKDFLTTGVWKSSDGALTKVLAKGDLNINDFLFNYSIDGAFHTFASLAGAGINSFNDAAVFAEIPLQLKLRDGDFVQNSSVYGGDLYARIAVGTYIPPGNSSTLFFGSGLKLADGQSVPASILWEADLTINDLEIFSETDVSALPSFNNVISDGISPLAINTEGTSILFAYGHENGQSADEFLRVLYRKAKNNIPQPVLVDRFLFTEDASLSIDLSG